MSFKKKYHEILLVFVLLAVLLWWRLLSSSHYRVLLPPDCFRPPPPPMDIPPYPHSQWLSDQLSIEKEDRRCAEVWWEEASYCKRERERERYNRPKYGYLWVGWLVSVKGKEEPYLGLCKGKKGITKFLCRLPFW